MNPQDINKYLYIEKTPTWLVRTIYALGILCYLPVIYGYWLFIQTRPFYTWFIFPIVLFFTVYYLNSYTINLFYKSPDLKKHTALRDIYWAQQEAPPSVDIFLPICGEAVSVLEKTFEAVRNIPYSNKKVYVLDDKGGDEYKKNCRKIRVQLSLARE